MNQHKDIYDFFVQNNNLSTAIEMSKLLEQFKLDMHKQFWSGFNVHFGQKLASSNLSSAWKFSPYNTQRIRKDWEKSKILAINPKDSRQSLLEFVFAQAGKDGDFPFYWGVCWNTPPEKFSSANLLTLNAFLISKKINIPEPPKWVYWGYYKFRMYDPNFLIRCYKDFDGLIHEIVEDVWSLFSELSPLLEQINHEVKSL